MADAKEMSKQHWEEIPCGINLPLGEAGTKEFYDNLRRFKYEEDYPEIVEYVRFPEWRGKRVLEVGCGLGSDTQTWCEAGANLTAIDFAERAVKTTLHRLALNGLSADIRQGSALELPFEDSTFDLYYSWGVLMHTGDTQKGIDEAFRVLKPGGQAILMLYQKNSLLYRLYVQLMGRKFDDDAPFVDFYSVGEMKKMCSKFKVREVKTYYFLRKNVSRIGALIPRPIERLLGKLWGSCTYLRLEKPAA